MVERPPIWRPLVISRIPRLWLALSTLDERGLTWESFKPLPDRVCYIDFASRVYTKVATWTP